MNTFTTSSQAWTTWYDEKSEFQITTHWIARISAQINHHPHKSHKDRTKDRTQIVTNAGRSREIAEWIVGANQDKIYLNYHEK
jgi:hypothetical protein